MHTELTKWQVSSLPLAPNQVPFIMIVHPGTVDSAYPYMCHLGEEWLATTKQELEELLGPLTEGIRTEAGVAARWRQLLEKHRVTPQ